MTITRLTVPSIDELRDRYVADVRRLKIRAGVANPNVAPGSESYIKGQAVAAAVQLVMARDAALQDAQMGDAAVGDDIKRLCTTENIPISLGAGAVGYVLASCSGGTAYPTGTQCKTADGLRYSVATTTVANDGDPIPIVGIDVGTRTNKPAGTSVQWSSPPVGSDAYAVVDTSGLRFGVDADTDTTLQNKWIERKRHPPRGGNWAQVAEDAQKGSASIEKAFVYQAAYGPSTMHVAITVAALQANAYSRVADPILLLAGAQSVVAAHPEHADLALTTVADWDISMILKLSLPEPKGVGGVGGGWVDASGSRWPASLNAASPHAVALAATPSNPRQILVTSDVEPVDDAHIAIWSDSEKEFVRAQIASHSGTGPYTVNLYSAIDPTKFTSGDWIMADCEHVAEYAKTLAGSFAKLGPGQKTTSVLRLPRSYRKPKVQESWPCDVSSTTTDRLSTTHGEIGHVAFYRGFDTVSTTYTALPVACPVNSMIDAPPYCLRLGKLAFYEV